MPTENQRLEQRVAALQSDLNTKAERIDALTFSDNDRELSRRSWFDEAKRLEKEVEELRAEVKRLDLMGAQSDYNYDQRRAQFDRVLVERDALLLRWLGVVLDDNGLEELEQDTSAALSASVEPINDLCAESAHELVPLRSDCLKCGALYSAEPSEPVERDERAEFERAFVVQEGVCFSADRNEYRSMNGRPVERTDVTDLNLRLQGWQARAALERKPCH
ncbi:hypothetical protein [Pseudomonas danubii]|uniref:hypothetical protein n=1 Tax=Pseudomonas danubii TaxID=2497146 RepID=UPI003857A37A